MANELRVRANGVAGALSADIAIAGTSMSSAALADLPAVDSTKHAAITLFQVDTNGRVTKKEVIYVTAHTAAATTATIVKAQEGTTDQAWNGTSSPDKWVHAATVRDVSAGRHFAQTDTAGPTAGTYSFTGTTWTSFGTDAVVTAQAGDWIEVGVGIEWDNGALDGFLDAATIVSAARVNWMSGNAGATTTHAGVPAWRGLQPATGYNMRGGSVFYQLVAGDVSGGTVTIRKFARCNSAQTRALVASSSEPLQWFVKNHGPREA